MDTDHDWALQGVEDRSWHLESSEIKCDDGQPNNDYPSLDVNRKGGGPDGAFVVITKNVQSIYSEGCFDELCLELESIHWDILLVTETWREDKEEHCTLRQGHRFIASGGMKGEKRVAD